MKTLSVLLGTMLCVSLGPSAVAAQRNKDPKAGTISARRAPAVTMTTLSLFNGRETYPVDINNHGEIVAMSPSDDYQTSTALFWSARTGFHVIAPASTGTPTSLNDHGQVVGSYADPNDPSASHGFVWSARDGSFVDLGEFYPLRINNRGVILGFCPREVPQEGQVGYCIYDRGELHVIPGGPMTPMDMNDRGVVVGIIWEPEIRAFTWSRRYGLTLLEPPDDLLISVGYGINNKGTVLGSAGKNDGIEPAFITLWERRAVSLFGPAENILERLTNRNWFASRDFKLWIDGAGPFPLPAAPGPDGSPLGQVVSLNDRGEILGVLWLDGKARMVIWIVRVN